ncbi:MAG: hypothetical protein RIS76_3006 [Verrucomicrobiota bacterium]|jgi:PIN domain nuclease of toxin-antitoxin system
MNLLLDTHAALWIVSSPERVGAGAARAYRAGGDVFLSVASLWEMANKVGVGKLHLAPGWAHSLPTALARDGVRLLNVEADDCLRLSTLPLHHRDPFDRMLVAQALQRRLAILSVDKALGPYGVRVVW